MDKLHVLKVSDAENGLLLVENQDGKQFEVETSELAIWIVNGLQVTYEELDEVIEVLQCTTIKYMSVDTYADGGDCVDVYEHKAMLDSGEIKMDSDGTFIKSYKTEASAIKAANKLSKHVRII